MSTETLSSTLAIPATPKRKVVVLTPAQTALQEASEKVKEALEVQARARAKVEKEERQNRAKKGRECVPDLIGRLDPTTRELVTSKLLGVMRDEERQNVQDWMASLS